MEGTSGRSQSMRAPFAQFFPSREVLFFLLRSCRNTFPIYTDPNKRVLLHQRDFRLQASAIDSGDASNPPIASPPAAALAEQPVPVIYGNEDEFPLSSKLVEWGDVVTFDGMFPRGIDASAGPPGTDKDVAFLKSLDVSFDMAYGSASCDISKFICIPIATYGENMPTAASIVRDLRNGQNFSSTTDMEADVLPYLGFASDYHDEVHTDREEQKIFINSKDTREAREMLDTVERGELEIDPDEWMNADRITERNALAERQAQAHTALEGYMREKRLYYCLFHYKPFEWDGDEKFVDSILVFAVGVSHHSGNLVGVCLFNRCHNLCD